MRVVLATDGSEGALCGARFLARLRLTEQDEVVMLSVLAHEGETFPAETLGPTLTALRRSAARRTREILVGHAAEEIIRFTEQQPAGLIVLGSRGLSPVCRFLLGSVAERVARHAPCPVLVVRPGHAAVRRLLLGVDGSRCSAHAAEWLERFPLAAECEIDLLTVVTPQAETLSLSRGVLSAGLLAEMQGIMQAEREEARKRLEEQAARWTASGRRATPLLASAYPALGILEAAEARKADLIVLGSHGATALERFLLGSVAEYVLRHAPCSVLVVKGVSHPAADAPSAAALETAGARE